MGFFGKKQKVNTNSQAISDADKEKEETTAKKQRLLETEGGNKGAQLNVKQGQSVRRIFGN